MLSLFHTLYPLFHILFPSLPLSLSHQLSLSPATVFSVLCGRYTGSSGGQERARAVEPLAGARCERTVRHRVLQGCLAVLGVDSLRRHGPLQSWRVEIRAG